MSTEFNENELFVLEMSLRHLIAAGFAGGFVPEKHHQLAQDLAKKIKKYRSYRFDDLAEDYDEDFYKAMGAVRL